MAAVEAATSIAHPVSSLGSIGQSCKATRACIECNRKKIKCDMKKSSCSACFKSRLLCRYPMGRKQRTGHWGKLQCSPSVQREIKKNFDSLFNLLTTEEQDANSGSQPPYALDRQRPDALTNRGFQHEDRITAYQSTNGEVITNPAPSTHSNHSQSPINIDPDMGSTFQYQSSQLSWSGMDDNLASTKHAACPQLGNTQRLIDPSFVNLEFFSFSPSLHRAPAVSSPLEHQLYQPEVGPSQEAAASPSFGRIFAEKSFLEAGYTWTLVEELVEIYFTKVHCFVPILHKPQFMDSEFIRSQGSTSLELEGSLTVYCMLALAARFSRNPVFEGTPILERGKLFARKATEIWRICQPQDPSLEYLQGCILFAWYLYLAGPDSQGWLLVGMSSRLAYDLGLDKIDQQNDDPPNADNPPLTWRQQEERRRAWWSVWELDTFASAISCRAHAIDRARAAVKLPVSDDNWFSDTPLESVVIDPDPTHAWHSLRDCPNQDERAWFLLSNYLLLMSHELLEQQNPSKETTKKLEQALCCFSMLLPPHFQLDSDTDRFTFTPENFARGNWIVCTNIMVQGARSFIKFLGEKVSNSDVTVKPNSLVAMAVKPRLFNADPKNFRMFAISIVRTVQFWPPTYIPYASPIIGGLVIGPAAIFLRVAKQLGCLEAEMLRLCVSHTARFWKIGSVFLDIASSVTA